MKKLIPLLVILFGALYLGSGLRPAREHPTFDLEGFGRLPVLLNGRLKPIDTVARTTLLFLQGRQRVSTPELTDPFVNSPMEWLLDVIYRPQRADTYPTFKIDSNSPELLSLIGKTGDNLKIHYDSKVKQVLSVMDFIPKTYSRFSYNELAPYLEEIERQGKLAEATEPKARTPFQQAVLALRTKLSTYQRLKHSFISPESPDFFAELIRFQEGLAKSAQAAADRVAGKPFDDAALQAAIDALARYETLANLSYVLAIPSADPDRPLAWRSLGQALLDSYANGAVSYEAMTFAAMGKAWQDNRPDRFNEGVTLYRNALETRFASTFRKTDIETRFNSAEPFYKSMTLYVLAFFIAVFSWLRWPDTLGRAAFYLIAFAFLATTAGLLARMWIGGYAPVTNLYSSALFVGWVACGACLVLEMIFKNAIGSVAAGMIGFGTLLIAHHLSLTGDTLEMMRAVLDSNFWLATHVVTVTAGYGATFLAGFLAIIYIVRGLLTPSLDKTAADTLARMVYGIVCFATLFSFVGTILGGIWADQSWGRFWGWDPKENGALIIVIWNAVILHARWGGFIRQRGLMILAVFGNIVTAWSWFGTNLLEVGLHSYGFTASGAQTLGIFMISQLVLIALALIPQNKWRSFRSS